MSFSKQVPVEKRCNGQSHDVCAVCLNPVSIEEGSNFNSNFCSQDHEENYSCHIECMQNFIENAVNSAFMGSCPIIFCPCLHRSKKTSSFADPSQRTAFIVSYSTWSSHMTSVGLHGVVQKYGELSANLLPFLCSLVALVHRRCATYIEPLVRSHLPH